MTYYSANIYFVKAKNRNPRMNTSSGIFDLVNFENISHIFLAISIVDFKQVNVSSVITRLTFSYYHRFYISFAPMALYPSQHLTAQY